ncbi:Retrovirus-related Pol polyprotein from transposon TNT 1-94 [Senna tora]|uniref:Retrovirus-related Pol polyprotein from transposon TNT 1-94 n=1 Tax=Senna tora TaxID=362788 RepID=A0A834THY8_9FABA|nr:Retrovirus-related Pol polyprotein from transposon TNT 1-94 [Senna tora]
MFMCGKGKEDYLLDVAKAPSQQDASYKKWWAENTMVMSWHVYSMTTKIGNNFLLYTTAHDIWEATRESYSTHEKSAEIFEVEFVLHNLNQGDMPVHQYHNSLIRCWQILDLPENFNWSCSTDAQYFKKLVEKNRLYKFLLGLNENFEDVRGRILGRSSLPSLKEAFSEVLREESRKKINNTNTCHTPLEQSALTTRGPAQQLQRQGVPTTKYCDHYHKKGHTKDTCWEIHGKPSNWKPRSHSSAAHHVETTDSQPFSQNPIEFLQKLFVKIADGTMIKVSAIGSVKVSANLTLLNVLHVPSLTSNLLSVSKLTRDNHYAANFKSHGCSFHDLASGKMIGSAEEFNGLYLLRPTIFPAFHKTVLSVTCLPDILLWHYRLGHHNFHYMQKLYPSLFRNKSSILVQCDICQFSKHTRSTYSPNIYKPSQPFSLIHSDV